MTSWSWPGWAIEVLERFEPQPRDRISVKTRSLSAWCTACAVPLSLAQAAAHECPVPVAIPAESETERTQVDSPLTAAELALVTCAHGVDLDRRCGPCFRASEARS